MAAVAVVLAVLLVAAVLVAWAARRRARDAEARAQGAAAREREAEMLAVVGRRLLRGGPPSAHLEWIGRRVGEALGAEHARVTLGSAPTAEDGERAVRLPLQDRSGWLLVRGGPDAERVAEPLARLLDVALERGRLDAREAEAEAARKGNLAKTAVLHMVSHDLRPLVHAVERAEAEGDAARLRQAAGLLARLVDDLVDLSRLEAGTLGVAPEAVDLRDAVARAADDHAGIEVVLPRDLPPVLADRAQLERVLANLVANAVRFSPPGATVRITGGAAGGRVTIRVIDRGPGIPPKQRGRVFEPFFQGRPADEGAGLGLAISRGLVGANGGRLVLQSATEGETAFAVTLPAADPAV
jgi:two-component system, OmpR family, sensor histidine kinase KdpD